MAFAWPRPGRAPLVFDMATAAMARGEIMIAAREGHDLPPGTGVDADGQATTDPNAILAGGMLPMAGYKGSALALMVELLAGALIGENLSVEAGAADNDDGGPARGGELMIAIDPARFGDAAGWAEHGEVLFENMLAQSGVRLPGDRRYANRARTPDDGVIVPTALHDQIVDLAG
jgi:delta1-piperideine-2-carboxylate reductase